ncbi:uncharacterized protein LOC110939525 [Helianthus annuus]|uniref:uncharacterized protein LOC110939525 n=1 Tax=Helianthus annuus TaxID=4232 RepID=UPI000B8F8E41|nr:uncharacterized protein LOC110939525 [Helianthus annuus]
MIESNPYKPIQAIQSQLLRKHQLEISLHKVFRAKRIATTKIYGDYQEQYGMLRSYCDELLKANPGSTIKIDVEPCGNSASPTRQFQRVYFCFASMMRGFKMIGRPLLGVDGCFMKGPIPGQILSVVGIDGNNSIYPVCYALVKAETTQTWKWFLQLLRDDLGCMANSCFTFISDRQKTNRMSKGQADYHMPRIHSGMTKRIVNVKKLQAKCTGPLTPHATEVFDEIKKQAAEMSVLMVDSNKKWDLTGMPCKHAVAAIWDMSRNSIDAGIPEDWVDEVYWLSTWKKVYYNVIEPINGPEMWTPSECPTTLIPPKHHTYTSWKAKEEKKEGIW